MWNHQKCIQNWSLSVQWAWRPFLCVCPQSAALKESLTDPNKTLGQRPPPQGCLQYILDCNGVAIGPKQVQAKWFPLPQFQINGSARDKTRAQFTGAGWGSDSDRCSSLELVLFRICLDCEVFFCTVHLFASDGCVRFLVSRVVSRVKNNSNCAYAESSAVVSCVLNMYYERFVLLFQ